MPRPCLCVTEYMYEHHWTIVVIALCRISAFYYQFNHMIFRWRYSIQKYIYIKVPFKK